MYMYVMHMVHGIALVHAFYMYIYMYACSTGETRHDEREREGEREREKRKRGGGREREKGGGGGGKKEKERMKSADTHACMRLLAIPNYYMYIHNTQPPWSAAVLILKPRWSQLRT